PALICLPPIGFTLMRGQVNTLVLALLCGLVAGLIRQNNFRAGLYLAGAACIKVYPIFLAIYPLWHRNWRCLAGCLVGLFVGIVAIPVAIFGPEGTVAIYEKYAKVLLGPALGRGDDSTRSDELLSVNATWSQSFKVVAHKTMYLDPTSRPVEIAAWVERAHLVLGAALTLVVLVISRRAPDRT